MSKADTHAESDEPAASDSANANASSPATRPAEYVVVARRYRPQSFGELIGQTQVTQALENAINKNRVGHAYLFTGARGVGKTSAARILAKALNCVEGPTTTPCQSCDICQSVAAGNDVDVIEIDGASNRGIDEIRQLRSSIGVRPSRARFKIYIIDEVHMLTKEAFNALLKTLEEPPEHVKFVFCTTDPEKIPITVLSRCQRFDFAPIGIEAIVARLQEIVSAEGAQADTDALELLARKAAGSMRDSQSLLEQLLSFGGDQITTNSVHGMLGTADAAIVTDLVGALQRCDAAAALDQLDQAITGGVDVGQLAEQLVGYLRDVMAAGVGCSDKLLRFVPASEYERLKKLAGEWGLPTVMNAVQLVDQALVKMRQVLHRRTLVELALVRICELERLADIADALAALRDPNVDLPAVTQREKKTASRQPHSRADATAVHDFVVNHDRRTPSHAAPSSSSLPVDASTAATTTSIATLELTTDTATTIWQNAVAHLEGIDANLGRQYKRIEVDNRKLIVCFDSPLNVQRFQQEQQSRTLRQSLKDQTGTTIELEFRMEKRPAANKSAAQQRKSGMTLVRESYNHPWVREAVDLFEANVTHVHPSDPNKTSE